MITFTKEQLIASAHARIEFAEMMLAGELEPLKERTWSIELELARIALASLEAEPVISHVGSKNALDAIVAFIKNNRNPTLKDYKEVSERLFQDNCQSLSSHVIEYIKQIGEELEELRSTQDTAPPAPVSVPECFKRLLHHAYGMTMGHDWNKGTMAGHHRDKLCRAVEECRAAMLQGADGNSPVISDGWVACSERMPEIGQKVFYYFDIVGVHAGYYDGDNTFVKENGGGWLTGDVTHWMEWILPAPPKREV